MPKWFTRGKSDPGMTHRGVAPREGKSLWMGRGLWRAVASSPESGVRISALEARSGHPQDDRRSYPGMTAARLEIAPRSDVPGP